MKFRVCLSVFVLICVLGCATEPHAPEIEALGTQFIVRCEDKVQCAENAREECGGEFEFVGIPTESQTIDGATNYEMLVRCR